MNYNRITSTRGAPLDYIPGAKDDDYLWIDFDGVLFDTMPTYKTFYDRYRITYNGSFVPELFDDEFVQKGFMLEKLRKELVKDGAAKPLPACKELPWYNNKKAWIVSNSPFYFITSILSEYFKNEGKERIDVQIFTPDIRGDLWHYPSSASYIGNETFYGSNYGDGCYNPMKCSRVYWKELLARQTSIEHCPSFQELVLFRSKNMSATSVPFQLPTDAKKWDFIPCDSRLFFIDDTRENLYYFDVHLNKREAINRGIEIIPIHYYTKFD